MKSVLLPGTQIFCSGKPGPTTLIVGLVHGNEIVGKHVLEDIKKKTQEKKLIGTIITLTGNIDAYKKNERCIDRDLNRCFMDIKNPKKNEEKRALAIKKFFADIHVDYAFDIHSTSTKSKPMILCSSQKKSFPLAKYFPINYIITGLLDIVEGVPLLMHFIKKGTTGIAFEVGCHTYPLTIKKGHTIANIIWKFHNKQMLKTYKNQTYLTITDMIHTSDSSFTFNKPYIGFSKVKAGEIRGSEKKKEYSFKKDKIILMPNANIAQEIKKHGKSCVAYFGE